MKKRKYFVLVLSVFLILSLSFAYSVKSEKVRVIIYPPGNYKIKSFGIKTLENNFGIKYVRHFKKGSIIAYIDKNKIQKLKKLGYRVYRDIPVKAFLTESVPLIQANKVWKIVLNGTNVTGKGISVCVIDTGVDYTHADLGGCFGVNCKVIAGYDFVNSDSDPMDDNGHGTHVAGIIAANGYLKGVAPDAKIVAVKVLDANGNGYLTDIVSGIEWCINHSDDYNISVISMSLGTEDYHNSTYCDNDFSGEQGAYLTETINKAVGKGISVVVATGNEGNYSGISSPACIYNSTRVGATYDMDYTNSISYCLNSLCTETCTDSNPKTDNITCFTNRGGEFDIILLAPGALINSTLPNGYGEEAGTSMATPHVSGAIALIKQVNKNLKPKQIEKILNKTGKQIYDSATARYYPRIDVYEAVSKIIPKLYNPKVIPLLGNVTTVFNFTVNYTHEANISPAYVKVCIDSSCFDTSSEDKDFTNGAIFNYTTNLSYGKHEFFFEAFDGANFANTSVIHYPWVADRFWLKENEEINNTENLTGKYIISNSTTLNITKELFMKDSYVEIAKSNTLNITSYGNLTLINTSFKFFPNIWIFLKNESCNISVKSGDMNISCVKQKVKILNTSVNRTYVLIENSSVSISNSTITNITTFLINNASMIIDNSNISSLEILGNSSVKGYFSVEKVLIFPKAYFERYFPVKLVRDINLTPIDRNITLWRNESIANFSTQNGFAWVNAIFSEKNESYYLFVENYGFGMKEGKNVTLSANLDTNKNITLDIVIPKANVSLSNLYISPLTSSGIKDNTTITLNASEILKNMCILINSSSFSYYICKNNSLKWNFTWNTSKDGNYSLWINLTDFWGNKNVTKAGEIIVDNTLPEILLANLPKVVINSSKINITIFVNETNLNFSYINITSPNENFSFEFENFTSFIFTPNYTENYTLVITSLDKAGNENKKSYYFISRPEKKINLSLDIEIPAKIAFIYENSLINQTELNNTTNISLSLPDWSYNLSISFNNSAIELSDVNTSENSNVTLRIEQIYSKEFLKAFAAEVKANFSIAFVKLNYSDTAYTNDNYLSVYRCDLWNFTSEKCENQWKKINFTINRNEKIIEFNTTHFSAFAVKQEPYCGDGIVNQESEECDGSDFNGKTCKSFGYDYGNLICTNDCKISTSSCKNYEKTYSSGGGFISYAIVCKQIGEKCESDKDCCSNYCYKGFCANEIINISLICPEKIEAEEGNIELTFKLKNYGNVNVTSDVYLKNSIEKKFRVSLKPEEEKKISFEIFLEEGKHKIEIISLNDSCVIEAFISPPKIKIELLEKIKELNATLLSLNSSGKNVTDLFKILKKAYAEVKEGRYSEANALIKSLEAKIRKISQEKKIVKTKKTGKRFDIFLILITLTLFIILIVYEFYLKKLLKYKILSRKIRRLERDLEKAEIGENIKKKAKNEIKLAKFSIENDMIKLAKIHVEKAEKIISSS